MITLENDVRAVNERLYKFTSVKTLLLLPKCNGDADLQQLIDGTGEEGKCLVNKDEEKQELAWSEIIPLKNRLRFETGQQSGILISLNWSRQSGLSMTNCNAG